MRGMYDRESGVGRIEHPIFRVILRVSVQPSPAISSIALAHLTLAMTRSGLEDTKAGPRKFSSTPSDTEIDYCAEGE
jgi:hypothetical protein